MRILKNENIEICEINRIFGLIRVKDSPLLNDQFCFPLGITLD